MEGISETYLDCGTLLQTTEFCAGEKNGISRRHWENGQISSDEIYSNGKLISGRYYSLCNELVASIDDGKGYRALFGKSNVSEMHEYDGGYVNGEIKIFDENGSLIRIYHIKNGLKHGVEIDYYEMSNGKIVLVPRISINWVEGRIQGITKTWYPNGVQESQREMNNNDKNGLLTAWYRDGSLMLIEEYEQDKLIKGEYFIRGEKISISDVKNGKGTATIFDADGNMVRKIPYNNGKPSL
jgi:antitoxin component YwqK of YwqJK toxin-antitoxin module